MGWETLVDVDFDGIGAVDITLKLASGLLATAEGKVGKISADKTIGLCSAEDIFYGVIKKVDPAGDVAAVQHKGFKVVAYTGSPNLGYQELVANGAGGVKPPATSVGTKATLTTGAAEDDNAILFTAVKYGKAEEDISIELRDPEGNDQALAVDVVGRDIIVSLATGVAGAITSTAAEVIAAIADSPAADLVTAANAGDSTGEGVVEAEASADLAGGVDPSASVGRKVFVVSKDAAAGTLVIDLG
ncbi:MAG TPA: hypothetical protein PLL15_06110 [Syntrophales bacterium]|nr:hypothetical protein [Syntrophales bacterium]